MNCSTDDIVDHGSGKAGGAEGTLVSLWIARVHHGAQSGGVDGQHGQLFLKLREPYVSKGNKRICEYIEIEYIEI